MPVRDFSQGSLDCESLPGEEDRKRLIDNCFYFHGYLNREEAETLLEGHGCFLVRETCAEARCHIVLSIRWYDAAMHFKILVDYRGYFSINGRLWFDSMQSLIEHYYETMYPIAPYSEACLLCPVGLQPWEILSEQLTLDGELGNGVFGEVKQGTFRATSESQSKIVAIKTCAEKNTHSAKLQFLHEAAIMRQLDHENIVKIIGVALNLQPLKIVMELAKHGSLDRFLKKNQLGVQTKVKLCLDAATGFEYISAKKILHLDIAARNCLITDDANSPDSEIGKFRLLIGDFGLSKKGPSYEIQKGMAVSQRWAAFEALECKTVTTKSDVWSFGVLMWEIFSDAAQPYAQMQRADDLLPWLMNKNRMEAPACCPKEISNLMATCWKIRPRRRPTFSNAKSVIQECLSSDVAWV